MNLGRSVGGSKPAPEKPALDIASVLAHYGGDVPSGFGWKKMRCVHGERRASATVNTELGAYSCFSCGLKGDAIAVIRQLDSCDFRTALVKYKEITGEDAPGFGRNSSRNYESAGPVDRASYEESGSWLASKLRKAN